MKNDYHSNGKLLLSAEYLVLDGAKALAMPTKFGQSLCVKTTEDNCLYWNSFDDKGSLWYKGRFEISDSGDFTLIQPDPWDNISEQLVKLLNSCQKLNPNFVDKAMGKRVETTLEFPSNWGLGSSSTLINNLAQWAKVDPFELLDMGFGGSGYDIACASSNAPITYRKGVKGSPEIVPTSLDWHFEDQIFFVHLNKKMDSKAGIRQYRSQTRPYKEIFEAIETITDALIEVSDLDRFNELLSRHEEIIGGVIKQKPIQYRLFNDYSSGVIKSLGAWGGDFVLATGSKADQQYFKTKGYQTIIPFHEMKKP